jgi:hypothetical protein
MSQVGFEPTISPGERLQTHALDRAVNGAGNPGSWDYKMTENKINAQEKRRS